MSQPARLPNRTLRAIPQATLRRLRSTPSYFFLLWRWTAWLYALVVILSKNFSPQPALAIFLLTITFVQTLMITLYAPVFRVFLPRLPRIRMGRPVPRPLLKMLGRGRHSTQVPAADEDADVLAPIARTRNPYWDIAIYSLDVITCGLVMYFSGLYGNPHFGDGTPFYRYGISTALAAALSYRYRGGLTAAFGYEVFVLLGAFFPPPGVPFSPPKAIDIVGSVIDAPLVAVLAAYVATILQSYTRSKRREQDNVRNQQALLHVSETLTKGASNRQSLLQTSAEQIRKGGHFERLVIAVIGNNETGGDNNDQLSRVEQRVDVGVVEAVNPNELQRLLDKTIDGGEKQITFTPLEGERGADGSGNYRNYRIARLYLPIFRDGKLYLVLVASSRRQRPFESKHEKFLQIVGSQLAIALENMRLVEQTIGLVAEAERGRIAREIHDGVAQLVYMLSLNTETCAALAHRIAGGVEEDDEAMLPLAERLDRLVAISKQALWETRQYMFTLKPLITGASTLTQMLTSQVREFETISGLPVQLAIEGSEQQNDSEQRLQQKHARVGAAIFRITQEALTNAYKHAGATSVHVTLRHLPQAIEIEICDHGTQAVGVDLSRPSPMYRPSGERITGEPGDQQTPAANLSTASDSALRFYSGHGIRGMRERAEELGGTFVVGPATGGGFCVRTVIPL